MKTLKQINREIDLEIFEAAKEMTSAKVALKFGITRSAVAGIVYRVKRRK